VTLLKRTAGQTRVRAKKWLVGYDRGELTSQAWANQGLGQLTTFHIMEIPYYGNSGSSTGRGQQVVNPKGQNQQLNL
jgi:hypothetical protein